MGRRKPSRPQGASRRGAPPPARRSSRARSARARGACRGAGGGSPSRRSPPPPPSRRRGHRGRTRPRRRRAPAARVPACAEPPRAAAPRAARRGRREGAAASADGEGPTARLRGGSGRSRSRRPGRCVRHRPRLPPARERPGRPRAFAGRGAAEALPPPPPPACPPRRAWVAKSSQAPRRRGEGERFRGATSPSERVTVPTCESAPRSRPLRCSCCSSPPRRPWAPARPSRYVTSSSLPPRSGSSRSRSQRRSGPRSCAPDALASCSEGCGARCPRAGGASVCG